MANYDLKISEIAKYDTYNHDLKISEIAATYDTYSTLKDCRYLRLRSSDHIERNPFDINEIFDKKK